MICPESRIIRIVTGVIRFTTRMDCVFLNLLRVQDRRGVTTPMHAREIIPRQYSADVASVIKAATVYLTSFELEYAHGTSTAQDEAAWLVLEAANLSPVEMPDYDRELDELTLQQVEHFLRLRTEQRIPAAYITGRTWFAGLEFTVDPRVLIPRSPIAEFLTEDGFGLVDLGHVRSALDLCTGSGCIAVALAHACPDALVHATDLSADALEVASINVKKHALEDRIALFQGDLFNALTSEKQPHRYDLILSNPPYVDAGDMQSVSTEFTHEPSLGLAAGDDGLDLARDIIAQAHRFLSPAGLLVCEVGNSQPALETAFPDTPFLWLEFANGGAGVFALTREQLPL